MRFPEPRQLEQAASQPELRPQRRLFELAQTGPTPLVCPLLTYPGAQLAGVSVRDMVTRPEAQVAAIKALHERYRTPVVLVAMDLSVEAEAWGCAVGWSETEVPTVVGPCVQSRDGLESLEAPQPGAGRTGVWLEVVRQLRRLPDSPAVLGCMIGPFSLAARLFGVSELLALSLEDPDLTHRLVTRATEFLTQYAAAFREAGADGLVMAEPAAGLLSPPALQAFSSAYVARVAAAVERPGFALVLHNCAARLVHLPAVLAGGVRALHFGAPMDLPAALAQVPETTLVAGNLDPAAVFVRSSPAEVAAATRRLLNALAGRRNFILSSGCDVPPHTPLANLDAFFAAARGEQSEAA
jgi:uroporphyrinogen decarboxylase